MCLISHSEALVYTAISQMEKGVFNAQKNPMQFAVNGTRRISARKLVHNDGPITEKPRRVIV